MGLKRITKHNLYISYCLLWAFGIYTDQHTHVSQECAELFTFFRHFKNQISIDLHKDLDEYQNHLLYYLAHQACKVYLNAQFNANLLDLDENGAVLVVDYKMKILPKSTRETKAEFFGKKGWTLHTILIYIKKPGYQELDVHAYDHWSMDACQDSWFTANFITSCYNGPYYHNADLMMILGNWLKWYQINVKKWIFLEAGKAKTTIDNHHAQAKIRRRKILFLAILIYLNGFDREKDQWQKKQIEIPEPVVSTHTTPKNKWIVAMSNVSDALPLHLFVNIIQLSFCLQSRTALANETETIENEYFLEEDVNKSKRFIAATILENPRRKVEEGELDEEEIPKLRTIQDWISRYLAQHRQKMAEMSLIC
ncbi:hypothetical protein RhiirC2_856133 [Rhizophagus irregularis]|uniref:Uncharacterized protein n=1 Tax=Rhizophagus irregularis TaxID=588596 RepID=A0A2N1MJ37_9GLOM|nr:hypothetical protein RhiirC2_856133 [Rhizophagus irregularis]